MLCRGRTILYAIDIIGQFDVFFRMRVGLSFEYFFKKEQKEIMDVLSQKNQKTSLENDIGQSPDVFFFNGNNKIPHHGIGDLALDDKASVNDFHVVMPELHIQDHRAETF